MSTIPTRRKFLQNTIIAAAALGALPKMLHGDEAADKPRLRKAFKYDACKPGDTILEKLQILKSVGFEGVEIEAPNSINPDEAVAARDKTGMVIHGVIDSVHWKTRLSDPDAAVRAKGLAALIAALKDGKTYGATTCLVVPGRVSAKPADDESWQEVWDRSSEEIKKAIPTAEETGVKIAIECVWNNFITKPQQMVDFVDHFNSPMVGAYMDMSNMIKYGVPSADWAPALGPRLLKFDFKGYSKQKGWAKIGEGDENWPDVVKALDEIGYHKWATAEVPGPTIEELKDVKARMDKIFGPS